MLVFTFLRSQGGEMETSWCVWIKTTSTICKTQCQKFEMKMWISVGLSHSEAFYMKTIIQELWCLGVCHDNEEVLSKSNRGLCAQWGSSASRCLTCAPSDKRQNSWWARKRSGNLRWLCRGWVGKVGELQHFLETLSLWSFKCLC